MRTEKFREKKGYVSFSIEVIIVTVRAYSFFNEDCELVNLQSLFVFSQRHGVLVEGIFQGLWGK